MVENIHIEHKTAWCNVLQLKPGIYTSYIFTAVIRDNKLTLSVQLHTMTLYKFNKLTHQQKIAALELHSVLIGSREEEGFHVSLHQISAFYVEAYYPSRSIKVARLQSFKNTSKLKPYFGNMDVSGLI